MMQIANFQIWKLRGSAASLNEFLMSTNPLAIPGVGVLPAFPLRCHKVESGVSWVLWS
jgi:hypothetical protein